MGRNCVYLVRRPLIGLLYQPRMIDNDECGAVGGMRIGMGNRSTRRRPAPVTLCPPQISHDLIRARTRAAVVGNRRQTAWAMAQPQSFFLGDPTEVSPPSPEDGNRSSFRNVVFSSPRRRWVDNMKMDLRDIGWDGMVWIGLIWLRIGTSRGLLWTR
jgi:hypothetical protein